MYLLLKVNLRKMMKRDRRCLETLKVAFPIFPSRVGWQRRIWQNPRSLAAQFTPASSISSTRINTGNYSDFKTPLFIFMQRYRYIVNIDNDEVIMPQNETSWPEMMRAVEKDTGNKVVFNIFYVLSLNKNRQKQLKFPNCKLSFVFYSLYLSLNRKNFCIYCFSFSQLDAGLSKTHSSWTRCWTRRRSPPRSPPAFTWCDITSEAQTNPIIESVLSTPTRLSPWVSTRSLRVWRQGKYFAVNETMMDWDGES